MPKKWNLEDLDACYRNSLGSFGDCFEHASKQNIPRFIEEYRIAKVKDAIAPWIVGEKKALGTRQEGLGEEKGHRTSPTWNDDLDQGCIQNYQITKSPNKQMILDLGCGHGWYCFRLIEKWKFNGNITGVDVSEHNIKVFNDEIIRKGLEESISAKFANAEDLPFEDNYFDLVYSTEALEHIESPEKVFEEAARVLKPGGRLIITTPSGPIHRFWRLYFWLPMKIKRLFIPEKTPEIQKIYDNPLSWRQIKKASSGNKLELIDYHKSVLLPHESYIQFFPGFMQRLILFKAKSLELFGPLTSWMGLHHIAMWKKK